MGTTAVSLALVGMVAYGIWASLLDLAGQETDSELVTAVMYCWSVLALGVFVFILEGTLSIAPEGLAFAIVGGFFAMLGGLTFIKALAGGRSATATTIVGLYFIITVIIGVVFLSESFVPSDILGTVLAATAIVLIGSNAQPFD